MSIDNATHDELNKLKGMNPKPEPSNEMGQYASSAMVAHPCPHCGYCPTCGRPRYNYYQWPGYVYCTSSAQPLWNQQWQAFNANNMNKEPGS